MHTGMRTSSSLRVRAKSEGILGAGKDEQVLATIDIHADLAFDLEKARHGNPYTSAAHEMFQKLQFQNMLSRFDVEAVSNDVEDSFREVTDHRNRSRDCRGGAGRVRGSRIFQRPGNVLPLFAHPSGYGRISLAWGKDRSCQSPAIWIWTSGTDRAPVTSGGKGEMLLHVRTKRVSGISSAGRQRQKF